jgi:DNA-directed RNA polymerase specialized sigma24 family protein
MMKRTYLSREEQAVLTARAQDGDREAWGRLYSAFRKAILGLIAAKVGDFALAEDLCHDTFVRANNNLIKGKYDPTYPFYAYLRYLARLIVLDHFCGADPAQPREDEPADVTEPVDVTLRLEMVELLGKCCAKPHQILAVGFIKLLEWRPREVVEERSDHMLRDLLEEFFQNYLASFGGDIDAELLERYCREIFRKVGKRAGEVYTEAEYRKRLSLVRQHEVGKLVLRLFYTSNPEQSLYDWCDKVRGRMERMLKEGVCCGKAA